MVRQASHSYRYGLNAAIRSANNGQQIVFSAVSRGVYRVMRKSGFVEMVGRQNFAGDIFAALEIARTYIDDLEIEHEQQQ
ncbi:MAG: hypothetical protein R2682_07115 [Pyrinomonadaceae bacterium]